MKIRAALLAIAAASATMTVLTPPVLAARPERVTMEYRDLNLSQAGGRACSASVGTSLARGAGPPQLQQ
jgi:hypothetical protein